MIQRELFRVAVLAFLLIGSATAVMAQPTPGLYGADNLGNLFLVDCTTGAGTLINSVHSNNFDGTEIEYDNIGDTAWVQHSDGAFGGNTFDIGTGLSTGGSLTTADTPNGFLLAFNGLEYVGSTLYGTAIQFSGAPSDLYILDITTGLATLIGPTGFGPITGLAYDAGSGIMYGVEGGCGGGGGTSTLLTIDLTTGVGSPVGDTGVCLGSLQFGPDGKLYAGSDQVDGGNIYTINPATAASTLLGPSGFLPVSGLTLVVGPTPVPSLNSWGLMLVGALILAALAVLAVYRFRSAHAAV